MSFKTLFLTMLLSLGLVSISCSEKDAPSSGAGYIGTWERTWVSQEKGLSLKETLSIEEYNFYSVIQIVEINTFSPHLSYNGHFKTVDNTLEANISNIGIVENTNKFNYINKANLHFEELVLKNLSIFPVFIGTFFLDSGKLILRLDIDGDFSVTGDEGLFTYDRVENL